MRQDLRYAIRQLRKNPGFTLLIVITIAIGIGANTAIFSVINGFLRPLPVQSPEQIVVLAASTRGDETGFRYRLSFAALQDLRRQADRFSDIFAFNANLSGLTVDGKTSQFLLSEVTGNCFPALGLKPAADASSSRARGKRREPMGYRSGVFLLAETIRRQPGGSGKTGARRRTADAHHRGCTQGLPRPPRRRRHGRVHDAEHAGGTALCHRLLHQS